jgi:redox-sensitive bicupin YhaK (pirin superfamily)
MPAESNLTPSYEEKYFSVEQKTNQWCRIVAPNEQQGAIKIHQDVTIDAAHLAAGKGLVIVLKENRRAYLQVAKGEVFLMEKHCQPVMLPWLMLGIINLLRNKQPS